MTYTVASSSGGGVLTNVTIASGGQLYGGAGVASGISSGMSFSGGTTVRGFNGDLGMLKPHYDSCRALVEYEVTISQRPDSGSMFVSNFDIGPLFFHFIVWRTLNPNSKCYLVKSIVNYDEMHTSGADNCYVAFGSKTELHDFEQWVDAYSARFLDGNLTEACLPGPFGEISAITTKRAHKSSGISGEMAVWVWILENCKGGVFYAGQYMFFENASDAVNYRLRWTAED